MTQQQMDYGHGSKPAKERAPVLPGRPPRRLPGPDRQDERERARLLEGPCPGCDKPLVGEIVEFEGVPYHWACARDETFEAKL